MTKNNPIQLPNVFEYDKQPIHLLNVDGKPAFIAQQIGDLLGIKKVNASLNDSKNLEKGVDFTTIPANLIPESQKNLFSDDQHRITILFESGLYLFALRSNKPAAVPFIRWVIRDVIPKAVRDLAAGFDSAQPPFAKGSIVSPLHILKLMELENKGSKFAAKALTDLGFAPTPKQLELPLGVSTSLNDPAQKGGANA